ETSEVWVAGWDDPDVFGSIDLPVRILVRAVESNGEGARTERFGQRVVVVPTEGAALVANAMGADAAELIEGQVAGVGEFGGADGAAPGVDVDDLIGTVVESDALVLEVQGLFDAPPAAATGLVGGGFGGGDAVNEHEPELAEQVLV